MCVRACVGTCVCVCVCVRAYFLYVHVSMRVYLFLVVVKKQIPERKGKICSQGKRGKTKKIIFVRQGMGKGPFLEVGCGVLGGVCVCVCVCMCVV